MKVIAIDFDGCLCANAWPEIGEPIQSTIEQYNEERARGTRFILWTCREGECLEKALDWCAEQGLYFDAINSNLPDWMEIYGNDTRKIGAHEYWDDRAVVMGANG